MSEKGGVDPGADPKSHQNKQSQTPSKQNQSPRVRYAALTPSRKDEVAKHNELCNRLTLSDSIKSMADSIWSTLRSGIIDQEDGLQWYICCIYIASIERRLPYGLSDPQASNGSLSLPSVTVSELLMASNISIIEFLKKLQRLKNQVQLSEAVSQHLLGVKRKYLISCPLFQKFESIFDDIFHTNNKTDQVGTAVKGTIHDREYLDRKKFAWTLAMYAKSRANSNTQLVMNFHLLLCCLNHVMRMTPGFQLKVPFDALRVASGANDVNLEMLKKLCELYQAKFDEVLLVQTDWFSPVIERLPQANGSIDVAKMEEVYQCQYRTLGDIDELLFLDYDPHLVKEKKEPNNNSDGTDTTPNLVRPLMTPVRSAMTSVQHLRELLSHASDQGSDTLLGYFEQCATNPGPFVVNLLEDVKPVFLKGYVDLMGQGSVTTAEMRFKMAVRLYYRVMESLLKQEAGRLSEHHFSHLLHNQTSHKCLLACAVEVVMAAYSSNTLDLASSSSSQCEDNEVLFPWILNTFDLQGFDFFIVLENFILVEPKLTPVVVKHLQNLEQRLLESEAWKEGSPVFEALKYSEVLIPSTTVSGNLQSNLTSPIKVRAPQGSSVNSPRIQRSRGLSHFLNKVCRLAYRRLQTLCDDLAIAKDVQLNIWTCLEYCITKQPQLMKSRHLDQLLMCSVYAICRVADQEIKFKAIVSVYKEMPHAVPQIHKRVLMVGDEYDSIINFYNSIFTQLMKNYILQFACNKAPPNTQSPVHRASPSVPSRVSPHVRPIGRNLYISPLKGSEFKMPLTPSKMTPRTGQLVCLGDGFGSTDKFRGINNWLREESRKRRAPAGGAKSSKRLAFEQMDDSNPGDEDAAPMLLGKRKRSTGPKSVPFSSYKTE